MPSRALIRHSRHALLALSLAALAGCAAHPQAASTARNPIASTQPIDPNASLTLNEIKPEPVLGDPPAQVNEQAPVDALMLYAKAREEEHNDQRYTAITLLEQAATADPYSFDVQQELARLYLSINSQGDQAQAALEHAAMLRPDDLQTQTDLGRVYLSRGDLNKAVEHLRLATQTTEYQQGDDGAAVADYYLAQSLQKRGYDRAALDSYGELLKRLQDTPDSIHGDPEIQFWLSRPELLYAEVGRLHEKQNEPSQALAAYSVVAERSPDDLDTRQHMVHLLMQMGRRPEASRLAMDSIIRTHGSAQSIDMFRAVYRGDDASAISSLQKLSEDHPQDHALLFALGDLFVADGQPDKAVDVLTVAANTTQDTRGAGDTQVVGKLFRLLADQGKTLDAARLLVETSARRPNTADELLTFWSELTSSLHPNRLHVEQLQALKVAPEAEGAKAYWISRIALGRPKLLSSSLADSLAESPLFPPAYRFAISQTLSDPGLSEPQRKQRIGSLIAAAESANPAFGKELRGMVSLADASAALRNNNNAAAVSLSTDALGLFNEAVAAGDQSADLQMAKADAELIRGDSAAYEQVMWKVLSDRPDRDSAYTELFSYYQQNNRAERAVAVSQSWLLADPTNIGAQLLHIALLNRAGVKDEATKAITDMYAQHPDDAQVIDMARQVLAANGSNAFDQLLETRVASHPGDLPAVQELVNDYVQQKRTGEAVHLIDNARTAVAKDADQLYFVAHLYEQTSPPGDLAATEQTLSMAIKVDPNNAGASNDLGYEWADSGKNLTDAEGLIRKAIQLEPDNGAYLDSLGWVLYKQGRFGESRQYLEQAVLPDSEADPIVLDHLGDALYRLNQTTDAQKRWLESQSKLEERLNQRQQANLPPPAANDELTPLRLKLQAKLRQVQGGQPADVAPVSESSLKQANASE